jgi:hypothetical protein
MKGKYLLGSLLMALAGAAIALFAYTTIIEKPAPMVAMDSSRIRALDAEALLTSFQSQLNRLFMLWLMCVPKRLSDSLKIPFLNGSMATVTIASQGK